MNIRYLLTFYIRNDDKRFLPRIEVVNLGKFSFG